MMVFEQTLESFCGLAQRLFCPFARDLIFDGGTQSVDQLIIFPHQFILELENVVANVVTNDEQTCVNGESRKMKSDQLALRRNSEFPIEG